MSKLFEPLRLRDVEFRNRVFVSPMCQYSSHDGLPSDWHLVHLGSRAAGGAGLVMAEASAVSAIGRISPADAGIWSDEHAEAYAPIARFIRSQGAIAGIQLAHAGRKASTDVPWRAGAPLGAAAGGWEPIGPSAIPFTSAHPTPRAMTPEDIEAAVRDFVSAAKRALSAEFEVIELHMAHGYLMHEFLSPLTNRRTDAYGGSLDNRMRFPLAVAAQVRAVWPASLPLFVRISATDWVEEGWDLESSIELSRRLRKLGVDLVDCSSGGAVAEAKVTAAPGYQDRKSVV